MNTPIPKDWKKTLGQFTGTLVTQGEICRAFGVSATVVKRWRRESHRFDAAVVEVQRVFKRKPQQPTRRFVSLPTLSPDEIDEVLLLSIGLELSRADQEIVLALRDAIRQLRKEKRELASEVNRLRHAEHLRRSGASLTTHQSGNAEAA